MAMLRLHIREFNARTYIESQLLRLFYALMRELTSYRLDEEIPRMKVDTL